MPPPDDSRPANELGYLNAARKSCTLRASCQRVNYEIPDSYVAHWERNGRLTILLPDGFEPLCGSDRVLLDPRVANDDDFPSGILKEPVDFPTVIVVSSADFRESLDEEQGKGCAAAPYHAVSRPVGGWYRDELFDVVFHPWPTNSFLVDPDDFDECPCLNTFHSSRAF